MAESMDTRILIEKIQDGDQNALNDLFERYYERVRIAARVRLGRVLRRKMESGDIVQDAMMDALKGIGTFRYSSEGDFLKYVNGIVLNRIRDKARYWRRKRRGEEITIPQGNDRSSGSGDPLDTVETRSGLTPSKIVGRKEDFEILERALIQLREESKEDCELVVQVELEGRTYKEIAVEMRITPDAVRMRYYGARAALRKIYMALDKAS